MKYNFFYTWLAVIGFSVVVSVGGCTNGSNNVNTSDISNAISINEKIGDHYDEVLKGRGVADVGREEPNYVNVIGYISVSHTQEFDIKNKKNFQNKSLWTVPTYKRDKQFLTKIGTLPHKTQVVVREQFLTHKGYGFYSGYILVEKTDDKSQHYIDVSNFITRPYWTYQNDLITAASTGIFIAKYKQVSDYYPVTNDGAKVDGPKENLVLVTGLAGTSSYYDRKKTGIEAVVWKKWRYGYGGVECYFNSNDLTITY